MTKVIYDVYVASRARNGYADGGNIEVATLKTEKAIIVDDLQLPIHLCLGRYEAASQEELEDLITDLNHELARRV